MLRFDPVLQELNGRSVTEGRMLPFSVVVLIKRYVRTNQVPDESSSCARVETTNAATKPYELPVAELLDRLALSGELDQLTDEHMDRMEKTIVQGIDSILTVESWFVPDYDSERDPEFDSLRDAWQQLSNHSF